MKKRRSGFTLIELLVAIAILAILLAIVLSAMKKALDRGHTARCMSNLHQIHMLALLYSTDFGDWLPSIQMTETAFHGSLDDYHGYYLTMTTTYWSAYGSWGGYPGDAYANASTNRRNGDQWLDAFVEATTNTQGTVMRCPVDKRDPGPRFSSYRDGGLNHPNLFQRLSESTFTGDDSLNSHIELYLDDDPETDYHHPQDRLNVVYLDGHVASIEEYPVP